MAMIPNEEINAIRNKADIVDIISSYINLIPKGKNYFGVCPFHDDHSPSLSVSPEKQIYTCFVCGASGNVFTFVQNYENVDFVTSVKIVADKVGHYLNINPLANNPNKKYYDLLDLANKYFVNNLSSKKGEDAKNYLINERHLSEEIIKEFNIGLALNDNNLNKLLKTKGYTDKEIIDYSLAIKSDTLQDLFKNRITFPICNDKGNVVAFSARIYNGESSSKYINSKESNIFKKGHILYNYDKCKSEVIKTKTIIIVEGQIDAIRVYSIGYKNVVATMGTALTKDHISLLKKLNAKVILMMDNDDAGEKSTVANGEELTKAGIEVTVVRLSGNKDPDSYILEKGKDAFKNALYGAITYFDFKLNYYKKNKNLNKADELAAYINKIIDELNNSDDEVLKNITINKLSEEYHIDKEVIEAKLVKKDSPPPKEIKIVRKSKIKLTRYNKAAEAILYAMMNNPKYIRLYQKDLNYFPDKRYKLIANDILAFKNINKEFSLADFITYIKDLSYKDIIMRIINDNDVQNNIDEDFPKYVAIIKEWIKENQIEKLKEELKNETDINKKEEINDIIIKLKRESED